MSPFNVPTTDILGWMGLRGAAEKEIATGFWVADDARHWRLVFGVSRGGEICRSGRTFPGDERHGNIYTVQALVSNARDNSANTLLKIVSTVAQSTEVSRNVGFLVAGRVASASSWMEVINSLL